MKKPDSSSVRIVYCVYFVMYLFCICITKLLQGFILLSIDAAFFIDMQFTVIIHTCDTIEMSAV